MNACRLRLWLTLLITAQASPVIAHPGHATQLQRVDEALEVHATNQALHIKRGALLVEAGQWTLAKEAFATAETLGDAREVGRAKGAMHLALQDSLTAVLNLSAYLELHPKDPQALLLRARAQQDTSAAIADYQAHFSAVKQPHPGDFLAAARIVATSNPDQALAIIDFGLERTGMQAQLQRFAIEIESGRGELTAAIKRCRALEPQLHRNPAWHLDLAELLLANGQPAEAAASIQTAERRLSTLKRTPATAKQQLRLRALKPSGRIAG